MFGKWAGAPRVVRGINLSGEDKVVAMDVVRDEATLLVASEKGYGKRTALDEYRVQSRGGKGIISMKTTDKTGLVIGVEMVTDEDDIMLITDGGKLIRTPVQGGVCHRSQHAGGPSYRFRRRRARRWPCAISGSGRRRGRGRGRSATIGPRDGRQRIVEPHIADPLLVGLLLGVTHRFPSLCFWPEAQECRFAECVWHYCHPDKLVSSRVSSRADKIKLPRVRVSDNPAVSSLDRAES